MEGGKTVYDAAFKVSGHAKDITFDAQGTILSTEEEMDLARVPAAARAALRKAATGGKIVLVEAVKEGATTSYEAQIDKGGKTSEIKVDAAGKPVQ